MVEIEDRALQERFAAVYPRKILESHFKVCVNKSEWEGNKYKVKLLLRRRTRPAVSAQHNKTFSRCLIQMEVSTN